MKIIAPRNLYDVSIDLPSSKSISNRLLIIKSISGEGEIEDLSDASDTVILEEILNSDNSEFDVGHAGTTYRFLTALFSISNKEVVLTGSERMKKRPIGTLVDALNSLGADIEYLGEVGFPPLRIRGKNIKGGKVKVSGGISSQFISALMLIAPKMKNGLEINLDGHVVSQPYIKMTALLMEDCGVVVELEPNKIRIHSGTYVVGHKKVEKDWSAASFWYELVLIGKMKRLHISGLKEQSIQGDSNVKDIFLEYGIKSDFRRDGVELSYDRMIAQRNESIRDFTHTPDLVQPYIVAMAVIGENTETIGIGHLKIKETNRIEALKNELLKLGVDIEITSNSLKIRSGIQMKGFDGVIHTYEDHRMAMAFAPLAMYLGSIKIENPNVVEKSYPSFWSQLAKIGFKFELEN
jgi:3-phosphoshikimate 1-carboxyvinyltransferase